MGIEVVTLPGIERPAGALLAGEVVECDIRHCEGQLDQFGIQISEVNYYI